MKLATVTPTPTAIVDPTRIDELLDKFIDEADVRHSSKQLYRRTLRQYFNYIIKRGYSLANITRAHVLEYKETLLGSGMSSLTVSSYINSVRLFYEWTEAHKYYPNVAKDIRSPKRRQLYRRSPLSPEQATALLSYFKEQQLRDYAIVNLLLRTGLRTIEVIEANVEDITHSGGQRVLKLRGKGGTDKESVVVLTDKAYKPIEEYLAQRGSALSSAPLFLCNSNNNNSGRLTTRTISKIAKEGLKAIGLTDRSFTAHSLRHTTGTNILRAGGTLEQAQSTLRHSNPATTQIYTAYFRDEQRIKNSGEALLDSLY